MSLKQKKIQFKPRIKLNNNMLESFYMTYYPCKQVASSAKKKTMSRLCGVQSPNGWK